MVQQAVAFRLIIVLFSLVACSPITITPEQEEEANADDFEDDISMGDYSDIDDGWED